ERLLPDCTFVPVEFDISARATATVPRLPATAIVIASTTLNDLVISFAPPFPTRLARTQRPRADARRVGRRRLPNTLPGQTQRAGGLASINRCRPPRPPGAPAPA